MSVIAALTKEVIANVSMALNDLYNMKGLAAVCALSSNSALHTAQPPVV